MIQLTDGDRYDQFCVRTHARVMAFLKQDNERFVNLEIHPIFERKDGTWSRMVEIEADKHFYIFEQTY
jgi:hypothetical protein